ncbi:MAG: hypothetical protein K2X00_15190 [Nitrospiraceae bacterium]|nr:hypothetical protein [Nitrospiraceae bacterium]OQW63573.1 MAG: hypothetical protein BVN29_15610 [Nitrospira sp. ST-bin5]
MFFKPTFIIDRWVACFDLLGTKNFLARGEERKVFHAYTSALDKLRRDGQLIDVVKHAWFSDTFLIFAHDDSGKSFTEIDLAARSFAYFLLCQHIPFRGAISCGRTYADFDGGVYFGLGIVEAYEYAEGQDWIGLLLSQSGMSRLETLGAPLNNRLNWQLYSIPWKTRPQTASDQIPACIFGQSFQINGHNLCHDALTEMASTVARDNPQVLLKYSRAIEFIQKHRRIAASDR